MQLVLNTLYRSLVQCRAVLIVTLFRRETIWHSYMLRALLTFDSFRQEHVLNQNGEYQSRFDAIKGGLTLFNGASRDDLAHVMPFSFSSSPAAVKEGIRFWLKVLREQLFKHPPV